MNPIVGPYDLLAQGEDFEGGIGAAPEEHACGCKHCDEE